MKTKLFNALLCLLIFAAGSTYAVHGMPMAKDGDITIVVEAGGAPQQDIKVIFNGTDSTEAAFYIYLQNNTSVELTGIKLNVVNIQDSFSKELVGGYSITFNSDGEEIPDEGLTLPANSVVDIRLAITNFTHEGEFSGELLVRKDNAIEASAGLAISRVPNSQLAIMGFSDEGITLTQLTNDYEYSFQVYSRNSTPVQDLQIGINDFVIVGGVPVQPEVIETKDSKGAAQKPTGNVYHIDQIDGLDVITVKFKLHLPQEGEYQSQINLIYNRQRTSYPIKITRTRPVVPVDIFGLTDPIIATMNVHERNLLDWFRVPTGTVVVQMTLSENKGQEIKVNLPNLLSLDRKENDTTKSPATYDGFEVIDHPSKGDVADLPANNTITIDSRDARRIDLKINGLSAGEYNGLLEVGSVDGAPVRKDIRILVREPARWAWFWILLGIGLSGLVRVALNIILTMAKFRIEINQKRKEIENVRKDIATRKDLTQPEIDLLNKLLDGLDGRLLALHDQNQKTKTETDEFENIKAVQKIIPLLIDFQRVLGALPEPPFSYSDDRTVIFDKLNKTPSDVADAQSSLDKLKTDIPTKLKEFALNRINEEDEVWFEETKWKSEWTKNKNDFEESISNPEKKDLPVFVRRFWESYARYLQDLAKLIKEQNKNLTQAVTDKLDAIINTPLTDVSAGDVNRLLDTYQDARKIYLGPNIRFGIAPRGFFALLVLPSDQLAPVDPSKDTEKQKRIVTIVQGLIFAIAFFVAVISGYYVLYLNNYTWGGLQDHIIAILWSFGLFEVSNASLSGMKKFPGLLALADQITGSAPEAAPGS